MSEFVRDHDIVVYGASGFVGVLVAKYLAEHAPAGTRVALAGRSETKLAEVKQRLGVDWPVLVADADDAPALAKLAESARVVITTVGPYAKFGKAVVGACAAAGTDYVDLTGEVLFARQSIDDNHELARSTGARIVHSCGFDSIPSDLGVHVLDQQVKADGAGELADTTLVVTSLRGGISGGTIDSMRHQLDVVKKDRKLRRVAASPYSLSPDRAAEPDLGRQDDVATLNGPDINPRLRGTLAPFVMASYNTRVVRRSNALRDWTYGRQFRYREAMSVGASPLSPVIAFATKLGLGALIVGLSMPPTRFLLDRMLPKPGRGRASRPATRVTSRWTCSPRPRRASGTRRGFGPRATPATRRPPSCSASRRSLWSTTATPCRRSRAASSPPPPRSATPWSAGFERPEWRFPRANADRTTAWEGQVRELRTATQ
ncbi:saccharopine dehydrogenase family protein [Paractinoplanes durhamensis]|uniref:saccharopine dehydrogenase family protein n=1 Tax=Paractinoplanes durhamensis TaxID=113563 RepID=UPI00362927D5